MSVAEGDDVEVDRFVLEDSAPTTTTTAWNVVSSATRVTLDGLERATTTTVWTLELAFHVT